METWDVCEYPLDHKYTAYFRRSKEAHGGLGNMAGGFPLTVNGLTYSSSEALYQCARYPHLPVVQESIRTAHNGFAAKLVAKAHYQDTRPDWEDIRVDVMLHTLMLKYNQNSMKINKILEDTGDLPIVEYSRKDSFWGAQPNGDKLVGCNVLGKLWMWIRDTEILERVYPNYSYFPQGDDQLVDFIQY